MTKKNDAVFAPPSTEDELETICRVAYGHACAGRFEEAMDVCNALIVDDFTRVAGYRQRAAVKEYMSDVDGAIQDLRLVTAAFADEPADFYSLGILLLRSGATADAINAFGMAITLSMAAGHDYYINGSHLFRAEAYLKSCDYDGALADVDKLPDGYGTHIPGSGMRSKEDIFSEATVARSRKASFKFRQ